MKELKTIKDVLEECLVIWDELARTGQNYKPDTKYRDNCPCCHYVDKNEDGYCICKLCILRDLWGNSSHEKGFDWYPCLYSETSPYYHWTISRSTKDHEIHAKVIADYCREQLKKMEGEG